MRTIITKQRLEHAIANLNEVSGLTPNHDDYFVQGAYGGWQLMRRIPFSTAATAVTMGFVPKRQLFDIVSMMKVAVGIYASKMEEIKDSECA